MGALSRLGSKAVGGIGKLLGRGSAAAGGGLSRAGQWAAGGLGKRQTQLMGKGWRQMGSPETFMQGLKTWAPQAIRTRGGLATLGTAGLAGGMALGGSSK